MQMIQESTLLQIGAWNLYIRVLWYAESNGLILIKIIGFLLGVSFLLENQANLNSFSFLAYQTYIFEKNIISRWYISFYIKISFLGFRLLLNCSIETVCNNKQFDMLAHNSTNIRNRTCLLLLCVSITNRRIWRIIGVLIG